MRIKTNQEYIWLMRFLRVYRMAIERNKIAFIKQVLSNSFHIESMFSGREKQELFDLHSLAIERIMK